MNYFITAIDTDSGKTFVSAILCEALGYDYWKPIQAGAPHDTDRVKELVSNPAVRFHPEQYILQTPASPHAAAKIDNVHIELDAFQLPTTDSLIIEGAGGCLVPINEKNFVVDIVPQLNASVIVVADLYLGSINHTLLTIEALVHRKIPIKGIIFNGEPNEASQSIILHHTGLRCLLAIPKEDKIDLSIVKKYAQLVKDNWHE